MTAPEGGLAPAVLLLDIPDPVGGRWADALRAAGHAVVRVDGPTSPSAIRGDVVVLGREVPLDSEVHEVVARLRYRLVGAPDLVGRDALVAQVRGVLDLGPGVVTLVGAPGVGKSALAFVVLSDRSAVMGSPPEGPPPGVVVLLDDIDDRLAETTDVVRSLVARGARVLLTSRTPLGVAHERCIRVRPLDPASARRLLVLRAGRDDPAWDEVAGRLDGLPLALVLAGHAARSLTGAALLFRLADPLAVLVAPDRQPERHRSWLAAVAESWGRLADRERRAAVWVAARERFTLVEAEAAVGSWRPIATLQERSLLEPGPSMTPLVRAAIRRLAVPAP